MPSPDKHDTTFEDATLGPWRGNAESAGDLGELFRIHDSGRTALRAYQASERALADADTLNAKGRAMARRKRATEILDGLAVFEEKLPAFDNARERTVARTRRSPSTDIKEVLLNEMRAQEIRRALPVGDTLRVDERLTHAAQNGDWEFIDAVKGAPASMPLASAGGIAQAENFYLEARHPDTARYVEMLDVAIHDARGSVRAAREYVTKKAGLPGTPLSLVHTKNADIAAAK